MERKVRLRILTFARRQNAIHGRFADAELPGDTDAARTLCREFEDVLPPLPINRFAALVPAL